MESPEPFVERDHAIRIVALEILVMKVVVVAIGGDGHFPADHYLVEADMAGRRRKGRVGKVEQNVDRMRWHDAVDRTQEK